MPDIHLFIAASATVLSSPRHGVLIGLLLLAAVIDWRTYRIPNWLTVGGMIFGLLYNAISGAMGHSGLLIALEGLGAGLILLLPLYALRVMGAGDVKLIAMVGAFLGWPEILAAILCSLIAGGAAALAFTIYRKALRRTAGNVIHIVQSVALAAVTGYEASPMAGRTSIGRFPYGASVALGTTAWLCMSRLGYI